MKTVNIILISLVSVVLLTSGILWQVSEAKTEILVLAVLSVSGALVFYRYTNHQTSAIVKAANTASGGSDFRSAQQVMEFVTQTQLKLKLTIDYIRNISTADDTVHPALAEDPIGHALTAVRGEMKQKKEAESNQHWVTEGLARFNEVLRNKCDIKDYSYNIISNLVKYLNVNQGGLYIEYQDETEGRYLELRASYAYERRKYNSLRVYPGQGLLGQCMLEKDVVFITDVPLNYVQITSGLGQATPRNIVIVPLIANEVFYGAFELASFSVLQPHQLNFLKSISVSIAAEIAAIESMAHTRRLLIASDELKEKLQASEEELKQNLEELSATQEEMSRKQKELERKQVELKSYLGAIDNTVASVEFDMSGNILSANEIFTTITGYSRSTLRCMTFAELITYDEGMQLMWQNLREGKFFSGEFKMTGNEGKEESLMGTFNPIMDIGGRPEKVVMIAQFVTQDKEKVNELQATVQAFKATLPLAEFTADLQCKSANEKFLKMFGLTRIALRNKTIRDFVHKDSVDTLFNAQSAALIGKDVTTMTLPLKIADCIKEYETSVSVIRDSRGGTIKIILILLHQVESRHLRLAL